MNCPSSSFVARQTYAGARCVIRRQCRPSVTVSCGHETEMLLHRLEIAVIVQQGMAMLDTEGADDDVGRLADRDAQVPQLAIVAGCARGEVTSRSERYPRNPRSMRAAWASSARPAGLRAGLGRRPTGVREEPRLPVWRSPAFDCLVSGRSRRSYRRESFEAWVRPWRILSRSPSQPNPLSSVERPGLFPYANQQPQPSQRSLVWSTSPSPSWPETSIRYRYRYLSAFLRPDHCVSTPRYTHRSSRCKAARLGPDIARWASGSRRATA